MVDGFQLLTPSGDVERASRYERVRRGLWMFVSTLLAGAIVTLSMLAARELGYPMGAGPALLAFVLVDVQVFGWGMDRFELVPPWQFRESGPDE